MLVKKMSETVPSIPRRQAMFTVEENTGKTRSLEWSHDNVLQKIKGFYQHCDAFAESSLDTIREAYNVAKTCKYLPTATEGPDLRRSTYSVRICPLGYRILLWDVEEIKTLTGHVYTALSALHDVGLVHRDICLPNIVKVFETHQHPGYYFMLIDLETVSRADHALASGFCSFRFWTKETLEGSYYTPRSDLYHLGLILQSQMPWFEQSDAIAGASLFIKDLLNKKLDAKDALLHSWLQD
jgi:serine/threonine protein kinase